MTYTEARPRKKPAKIVRVWAYEDEADNPSGEAWAAVVESDGSLISISTDISVVSKAAFRAGFWVLDQDN